MNNALHEAPLGKKVEISTHYDPGLLFPIPRGRKPKFFGVDIWNGYELSWLDAKGKPHVAIGEFVFLADTEYLIESKSFKLYLNSFNNTRFAASLEVRAKMQKDLEDAARGQVSVTFRGVEERVCFENFPGYCLDRLDIACDTYQPQPDFLRCGKTSCEETLYTHLFRSNCPVTGQPDWASVQIFYSGPQIDHEGLLRYLVSFRDHQGFHEAECETIFLDILERCGPEKLSVYARFLRRGGLDINPFRSNFEKVPARMRLLRQ